jgi:hypothetical protein
MSNQGEMEYLELRAQHFAQRAAEQLQSPPDRLAAALAQPSETRSQRDRRELAERDAQWAQERRARARREAEAAEAHKAAAVDWDGRIDAKLLAIAPAVRQHTDKMNAEIKLLEAAMDRADLSLLQELQLLERRVASLEGGHRQSDTLTESQVKVLKAKLRNSLASGLNELAQQQLSGPANGAATLPGVHGEAHGTVGPAAA